MKIEYSNYAIDPSGNLIYVPPTIKGLDSNTYTVWGIGEYGLLHGAGAFLKRNTPRFVFNEPDYLEIERYYKLINKLWS